MTVQIFGKGKKVARLRRHARLRKKVVGTAERPRLVVTRSNRHMGTKTEAAKKVGELIAKKAQEAGITAVVFDRGGNKYTGRVAAVADGAREGGLAL